MNFWPSRPRQPLVGLALCATLGILLAHWARVDALWPGVAFALAVLGVILRPGIAGAWLCCTLAFFALHTLRYQGDPARVLAGEFAAGPRVVQCTGIVWSEPEPPASPSRTTTARFRLKLESITIGGVTNPSSAIVKVSWAGDFPAYGDRVTLIGSAANLEPPRNPGQFDFTAYLHRQGIWSEIHARFAIDCRIEGHGHGRAIQGLAYRTAHAIERRLTVGLENEPEIADLIASMVLGLRSETPPEMKALFQRTGTMHLFAVSGLNVAMLAAIVLVLLRPLRLGRTAGILITIPVLMAYALVTGLSASCIRATIMCSILLLGWLVDRRPLPLNSLAAAALVLFAWDTNQLFSPGFQFSFALVLVILWLAGRIQHWLEPFGQPDPFLPRPLWGWPQRAGAWCWRICAMTLGVTVSAWLGSLLFTIGYFHLFQPSALLANLVAVPIAFGVLALGLGTVLLGPVWEFGALLFSNANWGFAKALLWVLKFCALIPGGWSYVETPRLARTPICEITVLDLGEGSAIHVRAEGRDWLFDCGGEPEYERIVLPYLRARGVDRLDGLLLTHGDARHIGRASMVLDDFRPRRIIDSVLRDLSPSHRDFHAELAQRGLGKSLYVAGERLSLSPAVQVTLLYPTAGLARGLGDDKAFVLQLEAAGTRVLFMSDSGFLTEQWLLENEADLRSDVVVKGQHSRETSGGIDFLNRVKPRVVVCSEPVFGDSLEALEAWTKDVNERGMEVFSQRETGAVRMEIHPGEYTLRAQLGGAHFEQKSPGR
jgi:ComEC/Rec2-related protein